MRWARVDVDSIIRDCIANNVIYRIFATDAWSNLYTAAYLFISLLDVIWLVLFSVWSSLTLHVFCFYLTMLVLLRYYSITNV